MTNREKIMRELVTDEMLDDIFCSSIVAGPCRGPNEPTLCPMAEACKQYTENDGDIDKYMVAFKEWLDKEAE